MYYENWSMSITNDDLQILTLTKEAFHTQLIIYTQENLPHFYINIKIYCVQSINESNFLVLTSMLGTPRPSVQ